MAFEYETRTVVLVHTYDLDKRSHCGSGGMEGGKVRSGQGRQCMELITTEDPLGVHSLKRSEVRDQSSKHGATTP